SSRLKVESDMRYSVRDVFETFPWPQQPSEGDVQTVAEAGREIRRIRAESLAKISGGLRAQYRLLDLPGKNRLRDAHARLDAAVRAAYGVPERSDPLSELRDLNHQLARAIAAGQPVTPPGI